MFLFLAPNDLAVFQISNYDVKFMKVSYVGPYLLSNLLLVTKKDRSCKALACTKWAYSNISLFTLSYDCIEFFKEVMSVLFSSQFCHSFVNC